VVANAKALGMEQSPNAKILRLTGRPLPLLGMTFALRIIITLAWLCGPAWAAAEPERVISSFTIPDEWVGRLIGHQTHHFPMIPSGGEVHELTLGAREARQLSEAKLLVGIHPTLEPWLADWLKGSQGYDFIWLYEKPLTSGKHVWLVPQDVRDMIKVLRDKLEKRGYKVSEDAYNQLIKETYSVEKELGAAFGALPAHRRAFVSQHAGLEGFAGVFGLKVAGTIVESPTAETADPSARHYAELLKTIRDQGVKVVTVDEGQNQAFAQRLTRDAGIAPPVALSFEYLQKAGQPGDTWSGMMLLNGRRLAQALAQP